MQTEFPRSEMYMGDLQRKTTADKTRFIIFNTNNY